MTGTGNTVTGNQVPGQSGSGNGNYNAFGQMNGNNNTNNQQARPSFPKPSPQNVQ